MWEELALASISIPMPIGRHTPSALVQSVRDGPYLCISLFHVCILGAYAPPYLFRLSVDHLLNNLISESLYAPGSHALAVEYTKSFQPYGFLMLEVNACVVEMK